MNMLKSKVLKIKESNGHKSKKLRTAIDVLFGIVFQCLPVIVIVIIFYLNGGEIHEKNYETDIIYLTFFNFLIIGYHCVKFENRYKSIAQRTKNYFLLRLVMLICIFGSIITLITYSDLKSEEVGNSKKVALLTNQVPYKIGSDVKKPKEKEPSKVIVIVYISLALQILSGFILFKINPDLDENGLQDIVPIKRLSLNIDEDRKFKINI